MNQFQTVSQFRSLRLHGMAAALERQQELPHLQTMSFEQRLSLLIDAEVNLRDNKRLERILKTAKLKCPTASVEDINFSPRRGLDHGLVSSLSTCDWILRHQNLLLTGATGCGKTWLSCAFGNQAARKGLSVQYHRTPRLLESLEIARGNGSLPRLRLQLSRADLLILDDWGLSPIGPAARSDLLELIDDRIGTGSTIVTSQLPIEKWHEFISDPTFADAILDRLAHASHRIELKGDSLRNREM